MEVKLSKYDLYTWKTIVFMTLRFIRVEYMNISDTTFYTCGIHEYF
jgi:hypothetical protein